MEVVRYMANPAIVKILTKLAVDTATDAEKRRRLIILLLAPIIGLLLLIALIVYIITSPLSLLLGWLMPNEVSVVEDFQKEYGYNQNIGLYDRDYVDGSVIDFGEITFTDGATSVVYLNQLDSRWSDLQYGETGTIGTSGCGPTALAIVVSTFTGQNVTPVETAEWAVQNGYRVEGNGSMHSLIPDGAKHYGLTVESNIQKDPQKIVDALAGGKLVVAIMSKGHFTSSGHFIVLRGVTADGKILVADPASKRRSEQEWDLSLILDEAHKGAGAGGPFWIIG
jgi:hypothetical protein